jgi:predicted SnoaL-like aldol condensation-catalyzing enzyme
MATQADANKALVIDVLDKAFNKKNAQAAAELLTERYIQHNPQVPTGKAGFLQAVPAFYSMFPDLSWELKHIWADGDYVIAHSLYRFKKDGPGTAIVDIFRIKDGKLDEHWDVAQEIPAKMAHDNGMF